MSRNQPNQYGRYYAPDDADKLETDAWVEDDFDGENRYVRAVVTTRPPDGDPAHVTLFRILVTGDEAWYNQIQSDTNGKNLDKSHLKNNGAEIVKAVQLAVKLLNTTKPYPRS